MVAPRTLVVDTSATRTVADRLARILKWCVGIAALYYGAWYAENRSLATKEAVKSNRPRPDSTKVTRNAGLLHEIIQFVAKWTYLPRSCMHHTLRGDIFLRREPPVAFGKVPFVTETIKFVTSGTPFFSDNFDRYPDAFSMNIMGTPVTFIRSEEDAKAFLTDRELDFRAGMNSMIGNLGPAGILSKNSYHKNKVFIKKAMGPMFFDDFVPDISDITEEFISAMVHRKGEAAVIEDLFDEMDPLFHCIEVCNFAGSDIYSVKDTMEDMHHGSWLMPEFSRYCMSTDPERIVNPNLHGDEHVAVHVLKSIAKIPYFGKSRIDRDFDEMVRMVQDAVAKRKSRNCAKRDVFAMLMVECPNADTNYDSAHAFASALWALILGAQNNSYATVSWIIANAASNLEFLEAVRDERRRVLGNKPLREATADEIFRMNMVWYAMLETQRIYARGTGFRQCLTEKKVGPGGKFVLPEGRVVAMWWGTWTTNHVHYDFKTWSDPNKFDPLRFSPERAEQQNILYNGLMFGHGQNPCMGTKMARMQITVMFHKWIEKLDFKCMTDNLCGDDHSNAVARGVNKVPLEYRCRLGSSVSVATLTSA